jgi:protein-disulfide isomerase
VTQSRPLTFVAAALALGLSACDSKPGAGESSTAASGPIEPISAPNGGDWSTIVSITPEGGFRMGNPDAPVKLVEFASMTCPHCREFEEQGGKALIDTYVKSGRVSYEFRNFVMNGIDLTASVLARCNGPAGFFGFTRQLFADQPQWVQSVQTADPAQLQAIEALPPGQKLPRLAELAGLKQWAALRGLPAAKADQCLASQAEVDKLVQMQSDAVANFEVSGTPSFLLNGEMLELEGGTPLWTQVEGKLRDAIG